MSIEVLVIPPLLCALAILVWRDDSYSESSDRFLRNSRKRAREFPDKSRVRSRLAQIGRENGYEEFRMKQFLKAAIGATAIFAITLFAIKAPTFAIIVSGLVGSGIFFLVDHQLSQEVIAYRRSIEAEFASVIEMLTLSLSAGETPLGAITRISLRSKGLLGSEFRKVIESVRRGNSFQDSLDSFGRRIDSVVIRRFVDSLVTAMSRGAPLIEVLQRHAAEARQNQRNILMDKAGKAELSMMVPVVFLILPISVLFALWPSLTHLNLFAS